MRQLRNVFKGSVVRYVLYFLLIPIGYLNPTLNWIVIIFGPFLLFEKSNIKLLIEQKRYLLTLTLFIIVVLITGIFSIDPLYPVKNALNIISILVASYFICVRLRNHKELIVFINGVLIASFIFTILLYKLTFDGFTFNFNESETFGKNSSSLILFIGLIANLLRIEFTKQNLLSNIYIVFFLISIFFTASIKIILISILLLLIYLVLKSKFNLKRILRVGIALIAVIFILNSYIIKDDYFDNQSVARITSRISVLFGGESTITYIDSDYMTQVRSDLIEDGLNIFYKNPIKGIGLENTRHYLGTYTHNNFVEILAGTGIIGFGLFIYALFIVINSSFRVNNTQVRIILLVTIVCVILISNAQRIYDNRYLMIFLVSFIPMHKILLNEKRI